jgi:selenium metabolism protein YedF
VGKKTLDCRGLACPQPVISTKNALEENPDGVLTVIVDNETAKTNVSRFVESQGLKAEVEVTERDFHIKTIKGKATTPVGEQPQPVSCQLPQDDRETVVYISSEVMGRGDDGLGRTLMAVYLDTLSHFAPSVGTVIFVNAGVKLTVEDSPVLDSLKNLESAGVQILCCGTCLNHFGLKEKLKVGEISNMYAIIEAISKGQKVMMP